MVSRIIEQKGFDLLIAARNELMKRNISLVVLGTGQAELEKSLMALKRRYPKRVGIKLGFDNGLAHRIEAGSDIFLMPSKFEPCGLNQMYSLRYGTLPVVRRTGGLNDTVRNWNSRTGRGNGFTFKEAAPSAMLSAVKKAIGVYAKKNEWKRIVKNAMEEDNSWKKSAARYIKLYRKLLE
jgi:starch synthase